MSDPTPSPAAATLPARRPVEAWAADRKVAPWLLAAARAHEAWPLGFETDEATFDAALARVRALSLR